MTLCVGLPLLKCVITSVLWNSETQKHRWLIRYRLYAGKKLQTALPYSWNQKQPFFSIALHFKRQWEMALVSTLTLCLHLLGIVISKQHVCATICGMLLICVNMFRIIWIVCSLLKPYVPPTCCVSTLIWLYLLATELVPNQSILWMLHSCITCTNTSSASSTR